MGKVICISTEVTVLHFVPLAGLSLSIFKSWSSFMLVFGQCSGACWCVLNVCDIWEQLDQVRMLLRVQRHFCSIGLVICSHVVVQFWVSDILLGCRLLLLKEIVFCNTKCSCYLFKEYFPYSGWLWCPSKLAIVKNPINTSQYLMWMI